MIKSVEDFNFKDKVALVRVDFNVPLDDHRNITDDTRIRAALPTIDKILKDGGKVVLMSHLGRPKSEFKMKYSLLPVVSYLNSKGYKCHFSQDCIGQRTKDIIDSVGMGEIVMMENLRFHKGETTNDDDFCEELRKMGDVYVNDAFGTAHRAHASTYGVAHLFKERFAGFLIQREVEYLGDKLLHNPKKPFTAIIGGAKVSGKLDMIHFMMGKCDNILIGGGMMYTFYKAKGLEIGRSLLEESRIEMASEIVEYSKNLKTVSLLPVDTIVAETFYEESPYKIVDVENMPEDMLGMDIGPKTIEMYCDIIDKSETILWNGPMGVFEMDNFAKGTNAIARAMARATKRGATTIVGGGDSSAAIKKLGIADQYSHISTGGGASLEFLEGKELPGIKALES